MLSNAYLLAKFRFDTAENERKFAENLPKIGNVTLAWRCAHSPALSRGVAGGDARGARGRGGAREPGLRGGRGGGRAAAERERQGDTVLG